MFGRLRYLARAHAKVNLDLRVLGTRPDGYHELRTVFQTIELHDTLVGSPKRGPFSLKCKSPGVPLDDSNLVWRSAAALWTALGRPDESTCRRTHRRAHCRGGAHEGRRYCADERPNRAAGGSAARRAAD